jgi:hypothetical protein
MLNKLFGKKQNFYLELKETDGDKQPQAPKIEKPAPAVEAAAPEAKPAAAAKPAKKTSVKKEKKENKAETPAPAPAANANTNGKVEPKEVEFATKYLITPSPSRRRPGPSLNPFKDMARKAKLPNR